MKIAVLISGEYRTFAMTRPFMTFLDRPDVDVYFSTWNTSHQVNSVLGVDDYKDITHELIVTDLGFHPVACAIDEQPPNGHGISNMINRWKTGVDLIESSGIEYDYLLIVRPDLFIVESFISDLFNNPSTQLHSWTGDLLNDMFLFGEFQELCKFIGQVNYNGDEPLSWHPWFFNFAKNIGMPINYTYNGMYWMIRPTCKNVLEWTDVGNSTWAAISTIGFYLHSSIAEYRMHQKDWGYESTFQVVGNYYLGEYDEYIKVDIFKASP